MYLIDTDYVPEQSAFRGRPQKPLLILMEFLRRDRKVMEICFTRYEYKDAASCRSTLYGSLESVSPMRHAKRMQCVSVTTAGLP